MAQPTAATVIAIARILAQDSATTNPAVSDTEAVVLLADCYLRYNGDVEKKVGLLAASSSGLTFAAGDTVKTTTGDVGELLAAFPSDTNAVNTLQTPALALWTVRDMLDAYSDTGSGTASVGQSGEFQAWAWEKVTESTESEKARVYVYPPCNRTRYLTVRQSSYDILTATSSVVDLNPRSTRILARFLAWEMARLHTQENDFLQQILAPIPAQVLNSYFQSGIKSNFLPSSVAVTGGIDG